MRSEDAVQQLKEVIEEYESNTFSASEAQMSEVELDSIVAEIIIRATNRLDGVTIDSILYDLRDGTL